LTNQNLIDEDVLHIAKLVNLSISAKEVKIFLPQLLDIINYIQNLGKLDTSGISEKTHNTNLQNVTFTDGMVNTRKLSIQDLQQNATIKNGNFVVGRVI